MKPKADWMAWTLQLIVGFIAGLLLSIFLSYRRGYGSWLSAGCFLPFSLGVGLVFAAFATHYGDRIWLNDESYKMFPPQEPQQDNTSIVASVGVGLVGFALMAFALLRTFSVL